MRKVVAPEFVSLDGVEDAPFELVDTQTFPTGVVLTYVPKRGE